MQWRGVTIGNGNAKWMGVTMATFPPDWLGHNQSVGWFLLRGNNAMIKDGILGNAHR